MKLSTLKGMLVICMAAFGSTAQADITVGAILPLTVPLASLGMPIKASLDMWPKQIAGEKVNLIVYDDASDALLAVKNTRRLLTENKVDVILGDSGTPGVIAMAPVVSEAKTVQLAFAPAARPGGDDDWTFTLPQPVTLISDTLAKRMVADKIHKVAYLSWNESYGKMWAQAFKASAKSTGLEIVAEEYFAPPDINITAQALKVLAAKPDAVLIVAAGSGAAMPQATLRQRGWKGPIYQTHGAASPDLVRVGGKAMDGTVLPAGPVLVAEQLAADNPIRPVALAYVNAYEAIHGPNSRTQFGAHGYDALQVLKRIVPIALKTAKPGTVEFRQALRKALETEREIVVSHGVLNYSHSDHHGFDQRGVVMLRINDGRFELLP